MAIFSIEVVGLKEAQKALRNLRQDSLKKFSKAVNASAMKIRNEAIRRVPVSDGLLKSSIHVKMYKQGLVATIGTRLNYAKFVEFGTSIQGKKSNKFPIPTGYSYGSSHRLPISREGVVPELVHWSKRHGLNPWAVAYSIMKRGGNPAKPFLFPSFEMEKPKFLRKIKPLFNSFIRKL